MMDAAILFMVSVVQMLALLIIATILIGVLIFIAVGGILCIVDFIKDDIRKTKRQDE